jgi:sugar (pentulose or hexulose) kinase
MQSRYTIGLDVGTTECKVLIVDNLGNIIGEGAKPLEPFFSLQPGWAEQHPQDWWLTFCDVMKETLAKANIARERIEALGITTQRRTIIPLDQEGKELRPAILWNDGRAWPRWKLIRDSEPNVFTRTYKFLGTASWFVHKLTGEWRDSKASSFIGELQNPDTWDWDTDLCERAGLPIEKLPDLVFPGEVLGHVNKEAADETNLPKELRIVAGCGDKQSGALGSGSIGLEKLEISYGTALTLGSISFIRPPSPIRCENAGIPFAYGAETGLTGGFWTCTWFANEFCYEEVETARKNHVTPLKILDEKASKVPPGSLGLTVQPYWWGGRWREFDVSNPADRGTVLGWTGVHTKVHFYRALLEGIAQEVREQKEFMEAHMKTSFTDLRIVGGGSKSPLMMQITADVLGQNVCTIQTPSAEALGAAIDAAKGANLFGTVEDAIRSMSRVTKTYEPVKDHTVLYDKIYKKIYSKIHEATSEIYNDTFEITGFGGSFSMRKNRPV